MNEIVFKSFLTKYFYSLLQFQLILVKGAIPQPMEIGQPETIKTTKAQLCGAGVATPDPGEAPPMAEFSMRKRLTFMQVQECLIILARILYIRTHMNADSKKIDFSVQYMLSRYTDILKECFKEQLLSVAVFGSVARGAATFPQSDIDILIVMEGADTLSFGERFKLLAEAEEKLSKTEEFAAFRNTIGSRPNIQEIIFAPVELKVHPPLLLDLATDVIILHDTGMLKSEIHKLKKRLEELGAKRVELKDSWFWILKPDLKLGETVEL